MPRLLSVLLVSALSLGGSLAAAQTAPPASAPAAAPVAPPDPVLQTIAAIKRLLDERPLDPTLYFFLASFQSQAGLRDDALASLKKVNELGDGFLPGPHFGFDKLLADPDFDTIRASLEGRLPVVAGAKVAFTLPDKAFAPEGIAYDPNSRSFFVGSVTQKQIVRIGPGGKITRFAGASEGLQQILGLTVDTRRNRLYAVSTTAVANAVPPYNAVLAFDLKTGKRTGEFLVPDAQQLNDVVAARDGKLYATDSAAGTVIKFDPRHKSGKPTVFLPAGTIRGSNGLALTPDGKALYVAHSTGVVRIDTASGKVDRLAPPPRQSISTIDGLYWWRGDLVGIQNIINPGRVIRIRLDKGGTKISRVDTLQSHHNPAFDQPTTGAIAGKALYVLGTTQLPRYNARGEMENAAGLKNPKIVKVPLAKK